MSQIESKVDCDLPEQPAQATRRTPRDVIARFVTVAALIGLVGLIVFLGQTLWHEWSLLQGDLGNARRTELVGYRDIAPAASYAEGPSEWYQENGDQSLLWARWKHGVGHQWFQFSVGDIDHSRLSRPKTNFVSRPVDYPLVETEGGEIWKRIPMDSPVVGTTLQGVNCVYPLAVLGKVQTINDLVEDHPFLVAINLFAPLSESVSIFDAESDTYRLTMAATGYLFDGKPLFYDRGTESLWLEDEESLKAVAGTHRGMKLTRVAHPAPVTWSSWLSRNQRSRLLVGADRSRGVPQK